MFCEIGFLISFSRRVSSIVHNARYLDQIDIFATIRMVLKRVKNVHSNGILIIISSFFIRSHKAVLSNVWN